MNLDDLPPWLLYVLLFVFFAVAPAVSPLLGPEETDAMERTAQATNDAAVYAANQDKE